MDQKVLAGIGNIYADEILHTSRIHPERRAGTLSRAELDRLHGAIGEVLADGDRGWRARASTPAIGRSSAWRGASWPRTPCTAAAASPAGCARSRS